MSRHTPRGPRVRFLPGLLLLLGGCVDPSPAAPADARSDDGDVELERDAGIDVGSTPDVPTMDVLTVDAPTVDVPTVDVPTVDVPTVDVPTVDVPDITTVDVPTMDVPTPDVPTTDVGSDLGTVDASISAPRPVAPASSAGVTSRRPTLRWTLPDGVDGAHVDLCRNRALTTTCVPFDLTGDHVAPASDLAPGVWFWRLRGRRGSTSGTAVSAIWHFTVGPRATAVDTSSMPTGDLNGDGLADLVVGSPTSNVAWMYPGTPTGVGATPVAVACPPGTTCMVPAGGCISDMNCDVHVAVNGDVNGDGYSDLLLQQATPTLGVRVHLGGAAGPTSTPWRVLAPPRAVAPPAVAIRFGYAGDVNRDGYSDVIVGALSGTEAAQALLYLGGATGLAAEPQVLPARSEAVGGLGDVNGDGYADVAAGGGPTLSVFLGGPGGAVTATPTVLRSPSTGGFWSVAGLGDVNGDGYGDVLAIDEIYGALIYHGGAAGLGRTAATTLGSRAMVPAGDMDGDGYADVANPRPSGAQILVGGPTGVGAIPVGSIPCAGFCRAAAIGDVNGDGFGDLGLSPNESMAAGIFMGRRADVVLGSAAGPPLAPSLSLRDPDESTTGFGNALAGSPTLSTMVVGSPTSVYSGCNVTACSGGTSIPHHLGERFGAAVAALRAGAFLVGAPGNHAAYVFSETRPREMTATFTGPAGTDFGAAVGSAGDVDRDGTLDVLIGAPGSAQAYLYRGAGGSIALSGPAGSHFGRVVAGVSDLDGDSFGEVVVSADNAVYVFAGSSAGLRTTPVATLTGPAGSDFGAAIMGVGDVNADGFGDFAVGAPGAAAVYVYYGSASGVGTTPSVTLTGPAGSEFGAALSGKGVTRGPCCLLSNRLFVGAPGASAVYLYVSEGAPGQPIRLITTPAGTRTGAPGSRFGARLSQANEGDPTAFVGHYLFISAPGTQTILTIMGTSTSSFMTGMMETLQRVTLSEFGACLALRRDAPRAGAQGEGRG